MNEKAQIPVSEGPAGQEPLSIPDGPDVTESQVEQHCLAFSISHNYSV